jgi:hypothetical protein
MAIRSAVCTAVVAIAVVLHGATPATAQPAAAGGGLGPAADDAAVYLPDKAPNPVMPDGSPLALECLFMEGTVVPRMAMGVRLPGADQRLRKLDHLELRNSPSLTEPVVARQPLFMPLYVYAQIGDGLGNGWCLLANDYAQVKDPRPGQTPVVGWASGEQLELLKSRYGYSFTNLERKHPVDLYASAEDAYDALVVQKAADRNLAKVLITERKGATSWDPRRISEAPPFLELAPAEEQKLPDTPQTFPLGPENRLLHIGAVCGGPVNPKVLARKRTQQQQQGEESHFEMLFVVDDTLSMQPYFKPVADFIAGLKGTESVGAAMRVVWYRDFWGKGKPVLENLGPLEKLTAEKAAAVATEVAAHKEVAPIGEGDQPEELMLDGIIAGIKAAKFSAGSSRLVLVIGDTGDRRRDAELDKLVDEVADLVAQTGVRLVFIRVGQGDRSYQKSFAEQAQRIADKCEPGSVVLPGNVGINDPSQLNQRIREAGAEQQRRQAALAREIDALERRNQYAVPGPGMEQRIVDDGGTLAAFAASNQQYYVPATGWMFHPLQPDVKMPQLRELLFLAPVEVDVLEAMFMALVKDLERSDRLNGEAAVKFIADLIAKRSTHTKAKAAIEAAWSEMPEQDRTLGAFLRDRMGMRVRNPVLFVSGPIKAPKVKQEVSAILQERSKRLTNARGPGILWYDSLKVLP